VCYEQFAVTEPPSPPWGEAKKMATCKQSGDIAKEPEQKRNRVPEKKGPVRCCDQRVTKMAISLDPWLMRSM